MNRIVIGSHLSENKLSITRCENKVTGVEYRRFMTFASSSSVRSQITTGDLPPKHGQTIRVGPIEEFVFHVWICSIFTNS